MSASSSATVLQSAGLQKAVDAQSPATVEKPPSAQKPHHHSTQPLSALAKLLFACEGINYVPPVIPLSDPSQQQPPRLSETHTLHRHTHASPQDKCHNMTVCESASCTGGIPSSSTLSSLLACHPTMFPFIVKPNPNKFALEACFAVAKEFPSQLDSVLFTTSSSTAQRSQKESKPQSSETASSEGLHFVAESYTLRHHMEALISAALCSLSQKQDEISARLRHLTVFHHYVVAVEKMTLHHQASISNFIGVGGGINSLAKLLTPARIEAFYLVAHMPLPTLQAAASVFNMGTPHTEGHVMSACCDPFMSAITSQYDEEFLSPTGQQLLAEQVAHFRRASSELLQYNGVTENVNLEMAWRCSGWIVGKHLKHQVREAAPPSENVKSSVNALALLGNSVAEDLRSLFQKLDEISSLLQTKTLGISVASAEAVLSFQRLGLDVQWELAKRESRNRDSHLVTIAGKYLNLLHTSMVCLPVTHHVVGLVCLNTAEALLHLAKHHKAVQSSLCDCICNLSDDEDGHVHVLDEEEGNDYTALADHLQKFGISLSSPLPQSHQQLKEFFEEASAAILHHFSRTLRVVLPTKPSDLLDLVPASTFELARAIHGAI